MQLYEHEDPALTSVATFGDHVYAYLTKADWAGILSGKAVNLPLSGEPNVQQLTIVPSASNTQRERATVSMDAVAITLTIPENMLISTKPEIRIETGDHRDYILRLEDWKNDYGTWSHLVESIHQRIRSLVI